MNYLQRAQQALHDHRVRSSQPASGDDQAAHESLRTSDGGSSSGSWSDVDGDVLELRVPFLGDTIFFVRSEEDVLPLLAEGICRGRIWTVEQLNHLFNIPDLGPSGRLSIALARALFDGDVVSVTRRAESAVSEESPSGNSGGREKREKRGKGSEWGPSDR